MGNDLAILVTFGAFLVDGNHLTNLMSIGHKTSGTGPFPPAPAIVGGLNTHGVFEGTLWLPYYWALDAHERMFVKAMLVLRVATFTLETIFRSTKHCSKLCVLSHPLF